MKEIILNDGNINIGEWRKTQEYSDLTVEEFKTTMAHEFVHICEQDSIVEKI